MIDKAKKIVENATVHLHKNQGQGVLVPGNLVLTAAHCITFECSGSMALGDYYTEPLATWRGEVISSPYAVEPVKDVAALGSMDDQECAEQADQFQAFCDATTPVPICTKRARLRKPFKVFAYYRKETRWVTGTATQWGNDTSLHIQTKEEIVGGMSGGPIVNEAGELVGLVSWASSGVVDGFYDGSAPRPHTTLPVWIARIIAP